MSHYLCSVLFSWKWRPLEINDVRSHSLAFIRGSKQASRALFSKECSRTNEETRFLIYNPKYFDAAVYCHDSVREFADSQNSLLPVSNQRYTTITLKVFYSQLSDTTTKPQKY